MPTIDSPVPSTPPKPPRTRCSWTAQERAEWVTLFESSGQTALEFCRDNDLAPATLSLWRTQLQGGGGEREGALVEIPATALLSAPPSAAAVRMHLPGGVRLEVAAGTDPAWLAALLRSMSAGT